MNTKQRSYLYVSARRVPGSSARHVAGIYVIWAGVQAPVRERGGKFVAGKSAVRVAVLQEPEWREFRQACGCPGFSVRPGTCRQLPVKYEKPEVSSCYLS